MIEKVLDNLDLTIEPEKRNRLFKSIIESVIWTRIGEDDAKIKVNFL